MLAGGLHERDERVGPQQRVDRERVGAETGDRAERSRRLPEEGLRVRGGRDIDVAALGVGDHQQTVLAGPIARPPTTPPSRGAPSRSKHATCSLTATQCSATASIASVQWIATASERAGRGRGGRIAGPAR